MATSPNRTTAMHAPGLTAAAATYRDATVRWPAPTSPASSRPSRLSRHNSSSSSNGSSSYSHGGTSASTSGKAVCGGGTGARNGLLQGGTAQRGARSAGPANVP